MSGAEEIPTHPPSPPSAGGAAWETNDGRVFSFPKNPPSAPQACPTPRGGIQMQLHQIIISIVFLQIIYFHIFSTNSWQNCNSDSGFSTSVSRFCQSELILLFLQLRSTCQFKESNLCALSHKVSALRKHGLLQMHWLTPGSGFTKRQLASQRPGLIYGANVVCLKLQNRWV